MSQLEGVTEIIGEHEYTMYMLPPIRSHNLLMDVTKMIGPSFGALIGSLMPSGKPAGEEDAASFVAIEETDTDTDTDTDTVTNKEEMSLFDQEINGKLLGDAVGKLFLDLNKKTFEQVIKAFAGVTHVDGKVFGKGIAFDVHFMGELDQMYKWLAFGMRVQWGKSLSALVSGASGPGAQAFRGLLKSQST